MSNKRNIGIIGHGSNASEVFAAILRVGKTPLDTRVINWQGELLWWHEETPPYDAKKRKRLFGKDES